MLSFFSDRRFLRSTSECVEFLYPFWGAPPRSRRDPARSRYDAWIARGPSLARPAALEDALVGIFPTKLERVLPVDPNAALAREFAEMTAAAGVPAVAFLWSDWEEPVAIPGITLFRTSLRRSQRSRDEHAMPSWSEDFLEQYAGGRLILRTKRERPLVGFCGFPGGDDPLDRVRRVPQGEDPRPKAIRLLLTSSLVDTNFILRWRFRSGGREPYVRNMLESDYVLCVRGAGNFSYRLYEALSCGRIPVFVDTDCVLPAEDIVDWSSVGIWVESDQLDEIDEIVRDHHASLSPESFIDLQENARRIWEQHLAPDAFFANLGGHFTGPPGVPGERANVARGDATAGSMRAGADGAFSPRLSPPARHSLTVTALLACHDRREQTLVCLASYFAQAVEGDVELRAVLVDDGSSDGTSEAVRGRFPEVEVVAGASELFWAGGMALAEEIALRARPDYLLWLNDDVVLDEDALERLLEVARTCSRRIVVGALRDPDTGTVTYSGVRRRGCLHPLHFERVEPRDEPLAVETFNGNAVLVSQLVYELVGQIDGQFAHAAADFDFGLRAGALGVDVLLAPGTVGTCRDNPSAWPWNQPSLSMRERLRHLAGPKGFPPRSTARYLRRHGGPVWPVFWVAPYVKFAVRALLAPLRRLDTTR